MSLVALASAKGSPGVTTTALALAALWSRERRVVLAEVDPSGSALAPRFGLAFEPGVTTLAPVARHVFNVAGLEEHLQHLSLGPRAAGIDVLVGPRSFEQGQSLSRLWSRFAQSVSGPGETDVVADCGRLEPGSPALEVLRRADAVVVVTRADLEAVLHTHVRVRALQEIGIPAAALAAIAVGDRPFPPSAVAEALDVPLLGIVAHDRLTAAALAGQTTVRHLRPRSPLLRSVRSLSEKISQAIDQRNQDLAPAGGEGATAGQGRSR